MNREVKPIVIESNNLDSLRKMKSLKILSILATIVFTTSSLTSCKRCTECVLVQDVSNYTKKQQYCGTKSDVEAFEKDFLKSSIDSEGTAICKRLKK